MKKINLLLIFLAITPLVSAYDYEANVSNADLPFSDATDFVVLADANSTVTTTYGEWLSGNETYEMGNNTNFTLLVRVIVPNNTDTGDYFRSINISVGNASVEKTFFFNIFASPVNETVTNETQTNETVVETVTITFTVTDSILEDPIKNVFTSFVVGNTTRSGETNDDGQIGFSNLTKTCRNVTFEKDTYFTKVKEYCFGADEDFTVVMSKDLENLSDIEFLDYLVKMTGRLDQIRRSLDEGNGTIEIVNQTVEKEVIVTVSQETFSKYCTDLITTLETDIASIREDKARVLACEEEAREMVNKKWAYIPAGLTGAILSGLAAIRWYFGGGDFDI